MNPKLEKILLFVFETFPERLSTIVSKIIRGFYRLYAAVFTLYWLVNLYIMIWYKHYNEFQVGFLFFTFFGLVALGSYLDYHSVFHRHFWKVMLLLTLLFYSKVVQFPYGLITGFIIMFPTIYALYHLGFHDGDHQLYCMIKRVNRHKFDEAVIKEKYEGKYVKLPPFRQKLQSWYWSMIRFSEF